ncbi:MAG: serine/threonine-protein kinase [Planctomycetota bacterium]
MGELESAVGDLADGRPLDWEHLDAVLSPSEAAGLRLLERARCSEGAPGNFELGEELGRGSYSTVRRARDLSLQRDVALKVLRGELSPERRLRFLEEARALAAVRHRNVVEIHSIDEQEGELRLVMELVRGHTFEKIVHDGGPLGSVEAARVGIELCRALAALHALGILHRDLKPANVMREEGGRVVLLDFGIAVSKSAPPSPGSAGTPRFMSPEQFRGEELGVPSDLWSLGVLLYWLVSARFPFAGETYGELEANVRACRPTPLLDVRPDLEPAFAAAIERALAPAPSDRYRSAGEFEQALRTLCVEPPPPSGWSSRASWSLALCAGIVGLFGLFGPLADRRGRDPLPVALTANWYAEREQLRIEVVPLNDGAEILPGDAFFLDVRIDEPLHLYVLNQDAHGAMFVLFPSPGWKLTNPIAAGTTQLPGLPATEDRLREHRWKVTSDSGGMEELFVVAAREPIAELDELVANLPAVSPGADVAPAQVDSALQGNIMRGIGASAPASVRPPTSGQTTSLDAAVSGLWRDSGTAIEIVRFKSSARPR